jgi:hypothetical protein
MNKPDWKHAPKWADSLCSASWTERQVWRGGVNYQYTDDTHHYAETDCSRFILIENRPDPWAEGEQNIENIVLNGIEDDEHDNVNHPNHYQSDNGIECIDAIRAALGHDGFIAYCRGNTIKYNWRSDSKGKHSEDLKKGAWYSNKAAAELEK